MLGTGANDQSENPELVTTPPSPAGNALDSYSQEALTQHEAEARICLNMCGKEAMCVRDGIEEKNGVVTIIVCVERSASRA